MQERKDQAKREGVARMKTEYTIYRTDGTKEDGDVDWPEEPGFRTIKAFVDPIVGDPLEHVLGLRRWRAQRYVCQRTWACAERRAARVNEAATEIYCANSVSQGFSPERRCLTKSERRDQVCIFDVETDWRSRDHARCGATKPAVHLRGGDAPDRRSLVRSTPDQAGSCTDRSRDYEGDPSAFRQRCCEANGRPKDWPSSPG